MSGDSISGFSIGQVFGLLDIVAGLLLVAALLTFGAGLSTYFSRLALAKRNESILTLEWGVRLLFVLVLVLGIVEYVQQHTALVLQILAVAVVLAIVYVVFQIAQSSGAGEDEH